MTRPSFARVPWHAQQKVHNHFAQIAAGLINQGQEAHPQLFLLSVAEDGNWQHLAAVPAELVGQFMNSPAGKDMYAVFLREAFEEGSKLRKALLAQLKFQPNMLVQINEVWVKKAKDSESLKGMGSIAGLPDREEALAVTIHTKGLSIPVVHMINPGPPRSCTLVEFPTEDSGTEYRGRFALQDPENGSPANTVH